MNSFKKKVLRLLSIKVALVKMENGFIFLSM